jgi:hypothetical protein
MKKIMLVMFVTCSILPWPVNASAQEVVSADYTQINGSDYYSNQSPNSANYSVLRDKHQMDVIRSSKGVSTQKLKEKVEAAQKEHNDKDAAEKREQIKNEMENCDNDTPYPSSR